MRPSRPGDAGAHAVGRRRPPALPWPRGRARLPRRPLGTPTCRLSRRRASGSRHPRTGQFPSEATSAPLFGSAPSASCASPNAHWSAVAPWRASIGRGGCRSGASHRPPAGNAGGERGGRPHGKYPVSAAGRRGGGAAGSVQHTGPQLKEPCSSGGASGTRLAATREGGLVGDGQASVPGGRRSIAGGPGGWRCASPWRPGRRDRGAAITRDGLSQERDPAFSPSVLTC